MPVLQTDIEDRLLEIVRSMELDWPRQDEMQARRLPWDALGDGTAVWHRGLTLFPLPPQYAPGTNLREDIGYGIGLAFIMPADHSTAESRKRVTGAREAVRRKIVHDRLNIALSGADFCQIKVFEPEVAVPKDAHRYEYSLLGVRAWVRESRT